MLDEVWVRCRRVLIHRLEAANVWIDNRRYGQVMQAQKIQGNKLKHEVLKEALDNDYSMLGSEGLFGPLNRRFQNRLPFCLSFGYEVGHGFYSIQTELKDCAKDVGRLSAAFNLGISIFDLIVDYYPDLFSTFSERFSESLMDSLSNDPTVLTTIDTHYKELKDTELRILLKIIVWFYCQLYNKKDDDRIYPAISNELMPLLFQAYKTEIASQDVSSLPVDSQLDVSKGKSTLPFLIICKLATIFADVSDDTNTKDIESLADDLATVFWLIDDISDLVRDLRSGSLNSLLVKTGQYRSVPYAVLSDILDGKYLEETADEISRLMITCEDKIKNYAFDSNLAEHFHTRLFAYIRDWIK